MEHVEFNLFFLRRIRRTLVNTTSYRLATTAALLAALVCAGTAQASNVTFSEPGIMTQPFGSLPIGEPFVATMTYDPGQPANGGNPGQPGIYPDLSLNISFGAGGSDGIISEAASGTIRVYTTAAPQNFPTCDLYEQYSPASPVTIGGLQVSSAILYLQSQPPQTPTTPWSTTALPTQAQLGALAPYPWPANFIELDSFSGQPTFSRGEFTPTPEPSSLMLVAFGLGLVGLTAWRGRRRKHGVPDRSVAEKLPI